jgi:Ca2+/Na+ antiporter
MSYFTIIICIATLVWLSSELLCFNLMNLVLMLKLNYNNLDIKT